MGRLKHCGRTFLHGVCTREMWSNTPILLDLQVSKYKYVRGSMHSRSLFMLVGLQCVFISLLATATKNITFTRILLGVKQREQHQ